MESGRRLPGTVQALKTAARLAAKACFPHFCVVCGDEGSVLCEDCQPRLYASLRGVLVCPGCGGASADGRRCGKFACPGGELDWLVSIVPYAAAPWRRLMHLWKYGGVAEAGAVLNDALAVFVEERRDLFGEAVPVPIAAHPWRLWQRGFNQSAVMAASVGEALGRAAETPLCRRFRWRTQVTVESAEARRRNAHGTFSLAKKPPLRAVLVDDTVTTGSTLATAARALRSGGAIEVGALTFLSAHQRSGHS